MTIRHDSTQCLPSQLYTAAQTRELDRLAIEEYGIPGFELMSRAGQAVFALIRSRYPAAKSLAVFCGAGNNGGDGFVVAGLALLSGWKVEVICLSEPENLTGAAQEAYGNFKKAGGRAVLFNARLTIRAEVIVDALLGTGLTRELTGEYAQAISLINNMFAAKIAVDIPSGLHADSGNIMGCAVKADATVTFIALKQGLFTGEAPEYCGRIEFAPLAVPESVFEQVPSSVYLVQPKRFDKRPRSSHKGDYGHVLVVGGDLGYSGAARLAAEAALRVGSGLVSVATRKEHAPYLNAARPELMCRGIENIDELENLLERATVLVIGPGLGQSEWSKMVFSRAIETQKSLVVDADGLNLLAESPRSNANWILTPHPGEAARLLGATTKTIQADRFAAVQAIQRKYGGITVLKGAGTMIASSGDIAVATAGNPGMASGGMGDVLAGVIAGLIAQKFDSKTAAWQGVCIHGAAADKAAESDGERGLLASDLFNHLRKLVN